MEDIDKYNVFPFMYFKREDYIPSKKELSSILDSFNFKYKLYFNSYDKGKLYIITTTYDDLKKINYVNSKSKIDKFEI